MSSTKTYRTRPGRRVYLATGIALGIVAIIIALWWILSLMQGTTGTTSIASSIYTLPVNSAGLCGEWHVKPSPGTGIAKDDVNIKAMDALSGNDIWIIGEVYGPRDWDDKQSRDLVAIHLDGSTSQAYSLQTPLGYSFPTVKMLSSKDVWASGPDTSPGSSPQLAHWDGSHWSVVPIELPTSAASLISTASTYFDLAALPGGDLWVSGTIYPQSGSSDSKRYSIVLRWDGTTWHQLPVPDTSGLGEMLAIDTDDLWIDGLDAMLHWDGQEWKKVTRPDGRIWDMAAAASDDVWAVGDESGQGEGSSNMTIMHWDGHAWNRVPTPKVPIPAKLKSAFRYELRGVTATGKEDAWAVGYLLGETTDLYRQQMVSFYDQQTIALHWDGTSWSHVPSPNFSASQSFSDVVAVLPNEVWAAGQVGPDIDERDILIAQFIKSSCGGN